MKNEILQKKPGNKLIRVLLSSGLGTSEKDCMAESTYWRIIENGGKTSHVWVCGLGYILGDVEKEGEYPYNYNYDYNNNYNYGYYGYYDYSYGSNNGDTPWISGGSNGSSGPSIPPPSNASSNVKKIVLAVNLDAEGIKELNRAIDDLLKSCSYKALFDYLTAKGKKISSIAIDPAQKAPGAYNPVTNKMTYSSNSSIYIAFTEEFIHFFQQNYYEGGAAQYIDRKGHANIEFEAKLTQDILNTINPRGSFQYYGLNADSPYGEEYLDWLGKITKKGTQMPNYNDLVEIKSPEKNLNYWHFMQEFVVNKPSYKTLIKNDLPPASINFLRQSGCNGK